jgi:hypothetical protein
MRKASYLFSMVGLLLVFTVKVGQAHRRTVRRRRVPEYGPISMTRVAKSPLLESRSASRAQRSFR